MTDEIFIVMGSTYDFAKPLLRVEKIERDPARPGWARLTLECGHSEELERFPPGEPPRCFRRQCNVKGCGNA